MRRSLLRRNGLANHMLPPRSGAVGLRWGRVGRMLAGWLWLAACLLLSAVSAGRPLWPGGGLPQRVPATEPAESLAFAAQKIETIRVGQRVFADNPQAAGRAQGTATAVDPSTWRLLRLRAEDRWADGTLDVIHVETLQPPEWVQRHGAEVGATV
ncbi:MAG TPA: hypothetical protein EYP56_19095, partial [Planctomycetaceae bacterium]|nr:hypothetical protein [Planctomycetaceae bacterium]